MTGPRISGCCNAAPSTSSVADGTGSLNGEIVTAQCVLRANHGAAGNL